MPFEVVAGAVAGNASSSAPPIKRKAASMGHLPDVYALPRDRVMRLPARVITFEVRLVLRELDDQVVDRPQDIRLVHETQHHLARTPRNHPIGVTTCRRQGSLLALLLSTQQGRQPMRGTGRAVFAATLLLIVGTLNIIYGIGALDDANIMVGQKRIVFSNLHTMGWVLIILGVIQLAGGFSLFAGNAYGRVIAIIGASLGAIGALLSIGGAYPWWSLGVFALCVYVLHGIL